jgi:SPP1 family predicted phage head-tail adaptor
MRAGILDRRVTIQRSTATVAPDGQPVDNWTTVGTLRRAAAYRPIEGDERFTAPQLVAREQVEFRVRYDASLAELNPLDRVIYPAMTNAEAAVSPLWIATRRVYDIIAVQEVGRRDGLNILAARHADVTI